MKKYVITAAMLVSALLMPACASNDPSSYDISKVFDDPLFVDVINGDSVPAEVIYGQGGEQGYLTVSSQDPEIVEDFVEAFREIVIEEKITDPDEMTYGADGINDYTFVMADGSRVMVTLEYDAAPSAHVGEKAVYKLGNCGRLFDLSAEIMRAGE